MSSFVENLRYNHVDVDSVDSAVDIIPLSNFVENLRYNHVDSVDSAVDIITLFLKPLPH